MYMWQAKWGASTPTGLSIRSSGSLLPCCGLFSPPLWLLGNLPPEGPDPFVIKPVCCADHRDGRVWGQECFAGR